jgi:hypothetical protein
VIGAPSRLRLIRKAAALARIFPHFDFSIVKLQKSKKKSVGGRFFVFFSDLPWFHQRMCIGFNGA